MSEFRFKVGATIMCNMGPNGWKIGTIIALHYREDHWPTEKVAPYQVMLETDHMLIYVPKDDDRYCRKATEADLRIAHRMDALAVLPSKSEIQPSHIESHSLNHYNKALHTQLDCTNSMKTSNGSNYRTGQCYCCDPCPRNWSFVELYSEHYRCAIRNHLKIMRRDIHLGTIRVGESIHHLAGEGEEYQGGFLQCPTLVRLPPGVHFSDDGTLTGQVRFDPHRDSTYTVNFVAVSTVNWNHPQIGIVRLAISFLVEGNELPNGFDGDAFTKEQETARFKANGILHTLYNTWDRWEREEIDNRETCNRMCASLGQLRKLLEIHPRLDGGRWWVQLGGLHMNVHKLLENTLFECELYLGYALTFGDAEVRRLAEQNLEGCYQKRLLEAARFMWVEGIKQMMRGEWVVAAETLRLAAAKKDGWGWAVNYGDIWISEAVARLIHGVELITNNEVKNHEGAQWVAEATRLLKQGSMRANEANVFHIGTHPWAREIDIALTSYHTLQTSNADTTEWLEDFKSRTIYWCAQVLGGAIPFPPQLRPRLNDAATLIQHLPGYNA